MLDLVLVLGNFYFSSWVEFLKVGNGGVGGVYESLG